MLIFPNSCLFSIYKLPSNYNLPIDNKPKNLLIIECAKGYKFKNSIKDLKIIEY